MRRGGGGEVRREFAYTYQEVFVVGCWEGATGVKCSVVSENHVMKEMWNEMKAILQEFQRPSGFESLVNIG